jgi:hypothetical protein
MYVLDAEADFVKDCLGLDGSDGLIDGPVCLQPMPETFFLAELHHDVQVRPRTLCFIPNDCLTNVLK